MKFVNKPKFCIITPTAYLDKTVASDAHLILGHLVDVDDKYAAFYKAAPGFKMMDNGAFELGESYAPDRLIDLGHKCGAHAIVLPDYPFQHWTKTRDAGAQWIQKIKEAGFKTFYVPQSETGDIDGWVASYEWAANNDDIDIIGMSILGIPNAIPHIHKGYARVVMTQILIERGVFNFDKHHHYLGLNSGPKLEIPSLIEMGALDTCDSSNPVWLGILGHRYNPNTDSLLEVQKPKFHVDFNCGRYIDTTIESNVNYNIEQTINLFNQ